jgi:hypothetical protein
MTNSLANGGTVIEATPTVNVTTLPPSNNLLIGATVTDSCSWCTYSTYGNPNSITDGNLVTGRNLGTYSGTFNLNLSDPKNIATLKLLPSMSPNGNVRFEVRTSTDAAGASGTWTTHGGQITSAWTSGQWVTVPLNANTTGVRLVQVVVYSSPSWVALYEIQGFAAGTSGTFTVAANTIPGATFQVPSGATSCQLSATGTWSTGPNAPISAQTANGVVGGNALDLVGRGVPLPSAPVNSLVAQHSSTGIWELIGSSKTLTVSPLENLRFMMNDATDGGYTDGNTGSLVVSYSCN